MKKHTATTHGTTVTRNSAGRTYTHAIVEVQTVAQRQAELANRAAVTVNTRLQHAQRDLARGVEGGMEVFPRLGREWHEAHLVDQAALVAQGFQALHAAELARLQAQNPAPNAEGFHVGVHGWAGRPDLAVKARDAAAKHADFGTVLMIEATMRDTKVKA